MSADIKHLLKAHSGDLSAACGHDLNETWSDGTVRFVAEKIDAELFHENIPKELSRTFRFDQIPGSNPLQLLMEKLPMPLIDGLGVPGRSRKESIIEQAKFDKQFVTVLWGYCNSALHNVTNNSNKKAAAHLWWLGRVAFSLANKEDMNSIKNHFLQLVCMICSSLMKDNTGDDTISKGLQTLAKYCHWLFTGRRDDEAPSTGIRINKLNMEEHKVMGHNACTTCGREVIPDSAVFCSGCDHPSFKNMISERYCSKGCLSANWPCHKKKCARRVGFYRAVDLFYHISRKFELSTFVGVARHVVNIEMDIDPILTTNVKKHWCISPSADEKFLWTGGSVFQDANDRFIPDGHGSEILEASLLNDMGPDLYMQLSPLIGFTLNGGCTKISIMYVYLRNVLVDTPEFAGDTNVGLRGKQVMFHPHPVLLLSMKDHEDDLILDIHAKVFGWKDILIPYKLFIQCRVAGIVKLDPVNKKSHAWMPPYQQGLLQAREEVMIELKNGLRKLNLSLNCDLGTLAEASLWQLCKKTRDNQLFAHHLEQVMLHVDTQLPRITQRIRDEGKYRLYFVHDPNPYSIEFRFGVTKSEDEVRFLKNIWMTDDEYMKQVHPYRYKAHPNTDEADKALRELCQMWIGRIDRIADIVNAQMTMSDVTKLLVIITGQNLTKAVLSKENLEKIRNEFGKRKAKAGEGAKACKALLWALKEATLPLEERDVTKVRLLRAFELHLFSAFSSAQGLAAAAAEWQGGPVWTGPNAMAALARAVGAMVMASEEMENEPDVD